MPHPDEGLIHTWLDGQLPPDEAARVEHLVATDPEWAAAVAEARGLIAASSRIVSALDHVPRGVVPAGTASPAVRRLPWWTKAAAAVVVIAGASAVMLTRSPVASVVATAPAGREEAQAGSSRPMGSAARQATGGISTCGRARHFRSAFRGSAQALGDVGFWRAGHRTTVELATRE